MTLDRKLSSRSGNIAPITNQEDDIKESRTERRQQRRDMTDGQWYSGRHKGSVATLPCRTFHKDSSC